ncbi:MAG: hypothetical protein ACTJHY_05480 [Alcaligenes pakistanensis]
MSILSGLMLMLTTPAQATETVVSLVRDMLLLEAEQARQNMSTCTPATTRGEESDTAQIAESPSKALTAMSLLELKAIYGRDTRLLAEVRQGQRLLVFQQGQLWPIGRDRDQHMRLLSLSNRCIELEIGQVQQQTESQGQGQGQGQTPALANTAPRSEQLPPQTIKLCLAS